jgi:RNA polymerase sigma-70 factor, ECF subfamily
MAFSDDSPGNFGGKMRLSLTRSESDACDLTQQTFYIWATKGHQLRDASKVKTWLFTTLHRMFLGARRRRTRYPHTDLEEAGDQLPSVAPERFSAGDISQVLTALARVDEVYQAAVALFYLEDCSYKDIAAVLEVPVGTVKSRIARGIAKLRAIMLSDEGQAQETLKQDTQGGSLVPVPGGNFRAMFGSQLNHSRV